MAARSSRDFEVDAKGDATDDSDSESGEDEDYHDVTRALGKDTFSGAIVAAVSLTDTRRSSDRSDSVHVNFYVKNLVVSLMHFGVLSSQFYLIIVLGTYGIKQMQDKFHEGTIVAKTQAIQTAVHQQRHLNLNGTDAFEAEVEDLCIGQETVMGVIKIILFFWLVKMADEVMDSFWTLYSFMKLPVAKPGRPLATKVVKDEKHITHTTDCLRVYFLTCVNGPRFLAALLLSYVGVKFLFFAKNLTMLIMKSLSLAFIVQLDELIFGGLASSVFKAEVKSVVVSYKAPNEHTPHMWNEWGSTLTKFSAIALIVLLYTEVLHEPIDDFREACNDYKYHVLGQTPFDFTVWTDALER